VAKVIKCNYPEKGRLNAVTKLLFTLALSAAAGFAAIIAISAIPGQHGTAAGSTPSVASSSPEGTHSIVLAGIRMTDVVSNGIRMTD
jgi:hypothetical protein